MDATETRPTMCVCKRGCEIALSWLARAPLAQCCSDDAECTCWCHGREAEFTEATKRWKAAGGRWRGEA